MYRKLSIPVGVAMLAALALVGMLGIFAFNAAQPAQADGIGSATVSVGDSMTGAMTDYTFSVTTNAAIVENTFINLDPPTGYTVAERAFDGTVDGTTATVSARAGGAYNVALPVAVDSGATVMIVIPGLMNPATAGTYTWMVDSALGGAAPVSAEVTIEDGGNGGTPTTGMVDVSNASVTARPEEPGADTQIKVTFMISEDLATDDSITFEVDDDLGVPGSIDADDVSITGETNENAGDSGSRKTASPRSIVVEANRPAERHKITLFIGNMDDSADADEDLGLQGGEVVVTFRQGAGITNRTEGGGDKWYVSTTNEPGLARIGSVYDVPWVIELSDYKGSRGDVIIAVGKGFKNGTTTHFWRDGNDDGVMGRDEPTLCEATANSGDIAECTFTLANPPFKGVFGALGDMNYINAVDGRNKSVLEKDYAEFRPRIELEPSMSITPEAGGPGDSINVQLVDLALGDSVSRIELSRRDALCDDIYTTTDDATGGTVTYLCGDFIKGAAASAGENGTLSFSFEIPNRSITDGTIVAGVQDLRIFVDPRGPEADPNDPRDDDNNVNVNLGVRSGDLQLSSTTVLPNQRISISGSGFTKSSNRANDGAAFIGVPPSEFRGHGCPVGVLGSVTLGGDQIDWRRINDNEGIEVTSGGTWSAPIDLPVNSSTTVAATRQLKIIDCRGGQASVNLTFPEREVSISPEEGGVGSEVIITGNNFPVENDHSIRKAYEVTVTYDADQESDDDDMDPDAIGSFTVILEVPEDAVIPSNNTVKVQFEDDNDSPVLETFTHRIPQGTVSFSTDTGPENSTLTIEARGFARYTSVDIIEFDGRDITPVPKPSTDTNGNGSFDIRIPGSDPGILIVRVEIDDVVATHTFTVVEGGGAEDAAVETVLGNIMSEDALDRIFRFDNTTKMWEWYIGDPAFASTNNLSGLSSGDLVYIKVTKDVTADVLGTSITLTCTNAGTDTEDCWNLVAIP